MHGNHANNSRAFVQSTRLDIPSLYVKRWFECVVFDKVNDTEQTIVKCQENQSINYKCARVSKLSIHPSAAQNKIHEVDLFTHKHHILT